MFTGIVEEFGVVRKVQALKNLRRITISARKALYGTKAGDSICVDGACLTVTNRSTDALIFDIMRETLKRTTLKSLSAGSKVNLERALKADSRLSGHFVQGHVDCVATISRIIKESNFVKFDISFSAGLRNFLAPKGSVSVDGVSLTVGEVRGNFFSVYLIPHTLKITTLGNKKPGDKVNLETDILAKYLRDKKKWQLLLKKGYFHLSRYCTRG